MTKTEKYSSCVYDKKLRGFILAEPWIRQPVRGGRGWPASPGVPRGPAGSSRPGLWLGICPDRRVPVLSFVKQAGDVTVDYTGVKESILAENTSEIEKYPSSNCRVVWGTQVLERIDANFPVKDTEQASFKALRVLWPKTPRDSSLAEQSRNTPVNKRVG